MTFFKRKPDQPQFYATVGEGLKKIYRSKLLPLEEAYDFHDFVSPPLNDPDFDAKPMILFVGQYSTGKTSLIRYLLEKDYPGLRIGPEPTTDTFNAVMYGDQEQIIPGNALVSLQIIFYSKRPKDGAGGFYCRLSIQRSNFGL